MNWIGIGGYNVPFWKHQCMILAGTVVRTCGQFCVNHAVRLSLFTIQAASNYRSAFFVFYNIHPMLMTCGSVSVIGCAKSLCHELLCLIECHHTSCKHRLLQKRLRDPQFANPGRFQSKANAYRLKKRMFAQTDLAT